VTIQPDGYITLRGVEASRWMEKRYRSWLICCEAPTPRFCTTPVINVELKDFEKPYFIVGGEVGHPGKIRFARRYERRTSGGHCRRPECFRETFTDLGVPPRAGRLDASKKVNLKKMLKEANLEEDMPNCKRAISCSCQKTPFRRSSDLFLLRQSACIRTQSYTSRFSGE